MLSVFLDVFKEPLPAGVPLRFRLRLNTSFSKISSTQKLCYPQCKYLQGEAVKGTALGIFWNPIFSSAPKSSSGSLMVFKTCIALLKCTSMLFLKMKPKETVEEKKNKSPCTHFLYPHAGHTLCIGIKRKVALHSRFLCKSRDTVSLCSEAQGLISGWLDADSLGPFVTDCSYFRAGQTFAE